MKFARYLQDALTPEWKDAYIDYSALKIQLRAIRADDPLQLHMSSRSTRTIVDLTIPKTEGKFKEKETRVDQSSTANLPLSEIDSTSRFSDLDIHALASPVNERMSHQSILPFFKDLGSPTQSPLHTILSDMPAIHVKFFDMLDAELTKVEAFYLEREKGMHEYAKLLKKQLHELEAHRQMFYESSAQSNARSWAKKVYLALLSLNRFSKPKTKCKGLHQANRNSTVLPEPKRRRLSFVGTPHSELENRRLTVDYSGPWKKDELANGAVEMDDPSGALDDFIRMRLQRLNTLRDQPRRGTRRRFDPQEYQQAKRRLRRAVSEHYRGLEALNNYRALNLAGFRKTLRKYEKITGISVLDAYMKEKVEPSAFGSGALVSAMIKEIEHHFAIRFERGDRKKAVGSLRVGSTSRTYHLSTFRFGWWLGLALPAVVSGGYLALQEYTRRTLPSWNILLFIYSVLVIPVLLAVLIGINIVAWTRNKINYVFIFRLNPKSRLDCREYFELPSILLCTLAYAFWFSLAQIGPPMLWPLIWLILTFVVMFNPFRCFMRGRARWWAIKKIAKLAASGMYEVEFTDVWLGDLTCSLVYSFSNLFFVGCFYTRFSLGSPTSSINSSIRSEHSLHASLPVNFTSLYQVESSAPISTIQNLLTSAYDPQAQTAWSTCAGPENWGWYFLLGMLPFLARFVQCLRRYRDAKLSAQLLNAGKYGMGIIYIFFYYFWRNQMNNNERYVLWCFIATLNSIYGYLWDILMDWAMCRPGARYPLLRPRLLYSSYIPYYYFAIISDLCIRFVWVSYIFLDEAYFEQGMFIAGVLEMLRRVQWNFFRLENKHLNNMNLHRVTREFPLPYECLVDTLDEEARAHLQTRKRLAHLS